jgi:rhomboid protease GluP
METRRMCPHCRAFITTKDRVCPYCNEKVGPRLIDIRNPAPILGGLIPHAGFITVMILIINFGLYVATSLLSARSGLGGPMNVDVQTLFAFGASFGPAIAAGQWWRLVTAGFLHGGLLHIAMNSWVLFDLGAQVEEIYGGSRMLVIYFISNVLGFYVSSSLHPRSPSVGASAALFGLVGAMIALGLKHRSSAAGAAIHQHYIRWLVYLLLFSLLPGVDLAAHVGGLIGGFCIAWIAGQPLRPGSPAERLWRVAACLCILLTVVSFLQMYLWFSHSAQ